MSTQVLLTRLIAVFTVIALLLSVGCSGCRKSSEDDGTSPRSTELPKLELRDDTPNLHITWIDAKGDTHVVHKPSDVPVEGRDSVRVFVEGREEGTQDQFYVADLRTRSAEGTYPVTTMSRSEWELQIERRRSTTMAAARPSGSTGGGPAPTATNTQVTPPSSRLTVIVYGADWCQPCHDAMRYLRRKGINAVEKNIEEDEGARREMEAKLRRAGLRVGGSIPVIDVRGRILQGFSQRELDKAIAEVTKGEEL